jgi:hypothetical protein
VKAVAPVNYVYGGLRMKPKTDEELIRIAEILLDSSTQKALRGLAYLRVLRDRINKKAGSAQFTLTHVNTPEYGTSKKKKWHMIILNII